MGKCMPQTSAILCAKLDSMCDCLMVRTACVCSRQKWGRLSMTAFSTLLGICRKVATRARAFLWWWDLSAPILRQLRTTYLSWSRLPGYVH